MLAAGNVTHGRSQEVESVIGLWKGAVAVVGFVSFIGTLQWIYSTAKKAVTWTKHPNRWDTFAMLEIKHRERKLNRELSADEMKVIIEEWFQRFSWLRSAHASGR
jgi:hypothetical protein